MGPQNLGDGMPNILCVRADFGKYTEQFISGGYVALGWLFDDDLSGITSREELYPLYKKAYPQDTSNLVIGQQVGQIARFLFDLRAHDFVITPPADTEWLHYGQVSPDPSYSYSREKDGCPYPHRRRVNWADARIRRGELSVPLQNTLKSSLTVFAISQVDEFLEVIGRGDLLRREPKREYDPYRVVLEQLLQLHDKEFEILVTHLLSALGFEGSEHVGKAGDGGVDATGELNVSNMARVKLFVQVKRYKLGTKVAASVVKQLRQSIPFGGQGALITTAEFQKTAADIALEEGFARIGLIDGKQLVDLLVEHWQDLPLDFQEKLGLKPGLVKR